MLHASDTCILCLSKKPEKKEHIIPDVIGGRLKSCILCNDCNSIMGYKLEKTFKTDPMIRIAIENLRDELPKLYKDYTEGLEFIGYDKNDKKIKMKKYKEKLKIKTEKKEDDSIIVDTNEAPEILKGLTGSRKVKEPRAYDQRIANIENDRLIEVAEGISIKKADIDRIVPDLTTAHLSSHAVLFILYEFFYLTCFGKQIFQGNFDFLRESILGDKIDERIIIHRFLSRLKYLPRHFFIFENGTEFKANLILFNSIYNILRIEGFKLKNNSGRIYIDDLLEKKFHFNDNLMEAKKGIFKTF